MRLIINLTGGRSHRNRQHAQKNLVKTARVVLEISSQMERQIDRDRETDRHTHGLRNKDNLYTEDDNETNKLNVFTGKSTITASRQQELGIERVQACKGKGFPILDTERWARS